MRCPCCSGKSYANCCRRYHQEVLPENALTLMRSRYSAYALGVAHYLVDTTHPSSPHYLSDRKQWLRQIRAFSEKVSFDGLEILETQTVEETAYVSFIAFLSKEGADLTFSERSRFLKVGQVWKYVDGKVASGQLTAKKLKAL